MGGAAFSAGPHPLHTPRMPLAVYETVRQSCQTVLRDLFAAVATPVEGPGKTDHGDVDILVAEARDWRSSQETGGLLRAAAERLGAVRALFAPEKATLAVPWPETCSSPSPSPSSKDGAGLDLPPDNSGPLYVQVDLSVAPSLETWHWRLFRHAHGDIWNIIGTTIRPLGLTADESALWLRVPEIEKAHRNRSKVFLTSDPATVLRFLGLPLLEHENGRSDGATLSRAVSSYWEHPFPDAWSLFEYVARSPYFVLPSSTGPGTGAKRTGDAGDAGGAVHEGLAGRSKANDRRRMMHRQVFHQWATEFVPAWQAGRAAETATAVTRDSVRADAFARFPGSQAEYEHRRNVWLAERHAADVWAAAKAAVPPDLPGYYRSVVCAAVRKRLERDGRGSSKESSENSETLENPDTLQSRFASWTVDGAAVFVAEHWQTLVAEAAPAEHARHLAELDREKDEAG